MFFLRTNLPVALCALALLFVSLACSQITKLNEDASSSLDFERRLVHDGRERTYLVHMPAEIEEGLQLPVVVNFHGGGGSAHNQKDYSSMDSAADEWGFLAVYPNGTGRFSDRLLTWNAGNCCGYAREESVDDVGFVLAMLADLEKDLPIDRTRVYATGLSNGGMMAFRLAEEASEHIAAIAPVGGARQPGVNPPDRQVPLLHIHSLDDPRALYLGGLGPPFPLTNQQTTHPAVENVLSAWAGFNQCSDQIVMVSSVQGAPGTISEGHTAEMWAYEDCPTGAEVFHWKLSGAGHVWPGGKEGFLESILGPSTNVVDANREIWQFFSAYQMEK